MLKKVIVYDLSVRYLMIHVGRIIAHHSRTTNCRTPNPKRRLLSSIFQSYFSLFRFIFIKTIYDLLVYHQFLVNAGRTRHFRLTINGMSTPCMPFQFDNFSNFFHTHISLPRYAIQLCKFYANNLILSFLFRAQYNYAVCPRFLTVPIIGNGSP